MYQIGEIDDAYLERELSGLKAERERLLSLLPQEPAQLLALPTETELAEVCSRVREWVEERGTEELPLIAQALQLSIQASRQRSTVVGVIPSYAPDCEHADVRSVVTNFGAS